MRIFPGIQEAGNEDVQVEINDPRLDEDHDGGADIMSQLQMLTKAEIEGDGETEVEGPEQGVIEPASPQQTGIFYIERCFCQGGPGFGRLE